MSFNMQKFPLLAESPGQIWPIQLASCTIREWVILTLEHGKTSEEGPTEEQELDNGAILIPLIWTVLPL